MMVDFCTSYGHEGWFEIEEVPEYLLDCSKAFSRKIKAQQSVRDFRNVPLNAEDYLVSEDT